MPDAVLRPARPEDLEAVLSLLGECGLPAAGVAEHLGGFIVAEDAEVAGALVGVGGLEVHGEDGVLRSVAVRPERRGEGLGAALTEAVLDAAGERGLRRLYLLTETAEEWFPRYGFRRIERSAASPAVQESVEFKEACPDSAIAMMLELEGAGAGS